MANEWHLVNSGPTPVMLSGLRLEPGQSADVPEEWYGWFAGYPGLVFTRNEVTPVEEPTTYVEREEPPSLPKRTYTRKTSG